LLPQTINHKKPKGNKHNMKKNGKHTTDKPGKIRRNNRPQKMNGIQVLIQEVSRISYARGVACFCTPGHNRGAGMMK